MSLEKVLQKMREEVREINATLALFLEDTIQPSVIDCEVLQQQIVLLQESIAIYKYQKLNKELSPSFNIHAKVSEKEAEQNKVEAAIPVKKGIPTQEVKVDEPENLMQALSTDLPKQSKKIAALSIGINDKFRFANELFAQNHSEYAIAVEQLINLKNWNDTEIYLNSLKSLYEWKETSEVVKYFYSIVKKRFD
jgi:hypothetical protein